MFQEEQGDVTGAPDTTSAHSIGKEITKYSQNPRGRELDFISQQESDKEYVAVINSTRAFKQEDCTCFLIARITLGS